MRDWKKMVAAGAAMLISVGPAYAGQKPSALDRVDGTATSARQVTSWEAKGSELSDPARAKTDVAASGDGSGYVTRDELEKYTREIIERVERARIAQVPAPTFTDAG
jgi:hypothetical protein